MGHIRSHSDHPGLLVESNALADKFTKLIALSPVELTQQLHALHYQKSKSFRKKIGLTRETDCQIVKQCDVCPQYVPVPHFGVNP